MAKKRGRRRNDWPVLEIFRMYKEGLSFRQIGILLGIPGTNVKTVVRGGVVLNPGEAEQVQEMGFKICSCCGNRIVPLEPISGCQLTRLCYLCWKGVGDSVTGADVEGSAHSVHVPSSVFNSACGFTI